MGSCHTYHKIALYKGQLIRHSLLGSVVCSALDLVVVVVQASDMRTSEFGNLPRRSSNTASDIQDSVSLLDANLCSQVVLVARNGLEERFTVRESAEVERLSPAVFIEVGSQVVVVSGEGGIFSSAGLEWLAGCARNPTGIIYCVPLGPPWSHPLRPCCPSA